MSKRFIVAGASLLGGVLLILAALLSARGAPQQALAAPIPPPEGYPKFILSNMVVSPTLASTEGVTLTYQIEIRNTGAYTGFGTFLSNTLPAGVTYAGDATASQPPEPVVISGVLTWNGEVGFDEAVFIRYSAVVSPGLSGEILNQAVISHPLIAEPVVVFAKATITDLPILAIDKTAAPAIPGANQGLVYSLTVTNNGQPAVNLPLTVTDVIPADTLLDTVGGGGFSANGVVTWTRSVSLEMGASEVFTFSVEIGAVPSGTVIVNDLYQVASPETGISTGEPFSVTVLDPIFVLSKHVNPDPPGANREMTYTLTLLNQGSEATGIVVTDQVPENVEYRRGGAYDPGTGVVSWTLDTLATNAVARFEYTVFVGDYLDIPVINSQYAACWEEGACTPGAVITSVILGPTFEVLAYLDPIAHKPGGGSETDVTPTLVVENVGPGNALGAQAILKYSHISISNRDVIRVIPPDAGTIDPTSFTCGENCRAYVWTGDIAVGEVITFTTWEGQSTIGGTEGQIYSTSITVSDTLGLSSTLPVTAEAIGNVTKHANLIPSKTAPLYVGAGQPLTYDLEVFNSGLSMQGLAFLTDTIPLSTTFLSASTGGVAQDISGTTVVSWTIPAMSVGDRFYYSFTVEVDEGLLSGTQVLNDHYGTFWTDSLSDTITPFTHLGEPVISVVREVGLVDSYKEVTPRLARPAEENLLTYTVHIVNSGDVDLSGVRLIDNLPWEHTTYLRDASAFSGEVISDIVSVEWTGEVASQSEVTLTFSVMVDPWFEGTITNTAVITHPSLSGNKVIKAVAYITNDPVLFISKRATPDPVESGHELLYEIKVTNLGQQATGLQVVDQLPDNGLYVDGSASPGCTCADGALTCDLTVLQSLETRTLSFRVIVGTGNTITNADYWVTSFQGVTAVGAPVVTEIFGGGSVFLPVILR